MNVNTIDFLTHGYLKTPLSSLSNANYNINTNKFTKTYFKEFCLNSIKKRPRCMFAMTTYYVIMNVLMIISSIVTFPESVVIPYYKRKIYYIYTCLQFSSTHYVMHYPFFDKCCIGERGTASINHDAIVTVMSLRFRNVHRKS